MLILKRGEEFRSVEGSGAGVRLMAKLIIDPVRDLIRGVPGTSIFVLLGPVFAIVLSLGIVGVIVLAIGYNPIEVYGYLIRGVVGSPSGIGTALNKAVPLMFVALATAIAFRAGIWNIGQEGQLQVAALATTWVALQTDGLPALLAVSASLLAGFLAGGLFGAIPGVLLARWGLSEIITTIMLDYIAILWVLSMVLGPMQAPGATFAYSESVPMSARLPIILQGTRLHAGIILALLAALAVWLLLYRTTLGFEMRAMGSTPLAARSSGMRIKAIIVKVMFLSGGVAGLAGATQILGVQYQLAEQWSQGWGFTGIAVALLGELNPLGIVLASVFFGVLEAGATSMQALTGVPGQITLLLGALPVIFLMGLRSQSLLRRLGKRAKTATSV